MTAESTKKPNGDQAAAASPGPYFRLGEAKAGAYDPSGASIVNVRDYPHYQIARGVTFCPVFGRNLSLNFVVFPAQSGFPSHTHAEEQISIVQEGGMEITVGELTRWVLPGDVIVFPPGVPHSGRTAGGPCALIDIFSPPREGLREVIAGADPARPADVDRWWRPTPGSPA